MKVFFHKDFYQGYTSDPAAAERYGGGCFAILEGGYNHEVLGKNVLALISGMTGV